MRAVTRPNSFRPMVRELSQIMIQIRSHIVHSSGASVGLIHPRCLHGADAAALSRRCQCSTACTACTAHPAAFLSQTVYASTIQTICKDPCTGAIGAQIRLRGRPLANFDP